MEFKKLRRTSRFYHLLRIAQRIKTKGLTVSQAKSEVDLYFKI